MTRVRHLGVGRSGVRGPLRGLYVGCLCIGGLLAVEGEAGGVGPAAVREELAAARDVTAREDPAAASVNGAGSSPTAGASDTTGRSAWAEAEGFRIMMGDSLDPRAHLFNSPDYQQELVLPGSGDIFLLDLKAGSVRILPRKAMVWTDGRLTPDLSVGARNGGAFHSDQGVVVFDANGLTWRVVPEPALVGPISLEALLQAKPEYVFAAKQHEPKRDAVDALRRLDVDTHVVVFFGTWCTFCRHWLPRFLKTLEVAANPRITAEFVGVSESGGEPKDAIARYKVTETPTFIVLQGGKEVGRIENEPNKGSIEEDLVGILRIR